MEWNPQPAVLQRILTTILESTTMNVIVLRNVTQKLDELALVPDYLAYLAYILTALPQEKECIRTMAGYLMKHNAHLILSSSPEIAAHVKASVLDAFDDGSVAIRNAAGEAIVASLGVLEPRNWPECLSQLVTLLDLSDSDKQEAAFSVLEKACQNYPEKLDFEIGDTRPLDSMILKFLSLADHPSSTMRSHAVACLSHFVPINCQSLFVHIDSFFACLLRRTSDDDPSLRYHVCQALNLLFAALPEKLQPEMALVTEYMLGSLKDKNENIALEAGEFWLAFAENAELLPFLQPLLDKVVPVLLDRMIYSKNDLLWLEDETEDVAELDEEFDIKLLQVRAKLQGFNQEANNEGGEAPKPHISEQGKETINLNEEDDGFDSDELKDEISKQWNLRKCATAALEVLAVCFRDDLLNVLLAPLKDKLGSSDWLQRESGILALGTIAKGCLGAIEPDLPSLIPNLISTLDDNKPLVRSISCWTLGRYADWITRPISDEHKQKYFIPTREGLLRLVLDTNKQVQEARIHTLAALEEAV